MRTSNYNKLRSRLVSMGKVRSVALKKAVLEDIRSGTYYREIIKKHKISFGYITKLKLESNLSVSKKNGGKPRKLCPTEGRAARPLIVQELQKQL